MLVYCSKLYLTNQKTSEQQLKNAIANHLSINVDVLIHGYKTDLSNGGTIEYYSTYPQVETYPRLTALNLKYPDTSAPNRYCLIEVGVFQKASRKPIIITIVSKLNDTSPVPFRLKQPDITKEIIRRCNISDRTKGYTVKYITSADVQIFKKKVYSKQRRYCIVLISTNPQTGLSLVDIDLLQALLAGIAEIYVIPNPFDSLSYTDALGKKHSAWGGGINILFPIDKNKHVGTRLLLPEYLLTNREKGLSMEESILATIIPYTIQYVLKDHITARDIDRALSPSHIPHKESPPREENDDLISLFSKENEKLESELKTRDNLIAEKDKAIRELEHKIDGLNYQLSQKQSNLVVVEDASTTRSFSSLQEVAVFVEKEMSERVAFNNGAKKAMLRSPYLNYDKVYQAFYALYSKFFPMFRGEISLNEVNEHLLQIGVVYNPKIDERNTYEISYKGRQADLNKHLKIGRDRLPQKTFRLHFEYDSEENLIIIHHAGRHLKTTAS
ncbi:MAG: hypothetical protein HQL06_08845 [Nitrospirae bacterium]|nr:hypothetical protein [Nitrospirota bacterium]